MKRLPLIEGIEKRKKKGRRRKETK